MLITLVPFPITKTVLKYRKHLKMSDQFQCISTSNKKLHHYISAHFWIHKAFSSCFASNGSGFQAVKKHFFAMKVKICYIVFKGKTRVYNNFWIFINTCRIVFQNHENFYVQLLKNIETNPSILHTI